MDLQTSEQLVPRGFYRVGNQKFYNKIEALMAGDMQNIHPTWDFHDEHFSRFNWAKEPEQELGYWYSLRCQQIRDKYSYITLHFSGGSDSHNILTHFYKNNIQIGRAHV